MGEGRRGVGEGGGEHDMHDACHTCCTHGELHAAGVGVEGGRVPRCHLLVRARALLPVGGGCKGT